jgi:hypothetical protein
MQNDCHVEQLLPERAPVRLQSALIAVLHDDVGFEVEAVSSHNLRRHNLVCYCQNGVDSNLCQPRIIVTAALKV